MPRKRQTIQSLTTSEVINAVLTTIYLSIQIWNTLLGKDTNVMNLFVRLGFTPGVKFLLFCRYPVDKTITPHHDGFTALDYAAQYGKIEIARILLNAGANVDRPSGKQQTPIEVASQQGHGDMVDLLLQANATVNSLHHMHRPNHLTAIHLAARNGHYPIINKLIEAGANDINDGTCYQTHPIFDAIKSDNDATIRDVVAMTDLTKFNVRNREGLTPLDLAITLGNSNTINYLLEQRFTPTPPSPIQQHRLLFKQLAKAMRKP